MGAIPYGFNDIGNTHLVTLGYGPGPPNSPFDERV